MSAGDSLWRGATAADLDWNQSDQPYSIQFDDHYHADTRGLEECRHVYIDGNQLRQRWDVSAETCFTIAETGFGSGLNFLATWQAWQRQAGPEARLHYLSIERYPLRRQDLVRALAGWTELAPLSNALLADYPPALPGRHRLLFDHGRVCLDLLVEDIATALEQLADTSDLAVDAWYLDGFTPSRNPEMWTPRLFQLMSQLGTPASSFATFTAASEVRRGLEKVGFTVRRPPGYGGKREMLCGQLQHPAAPTAPRATPWHLPQQRYPAAGSGDLSACPEPGSGERHALIIGAGLAGASAAAALAGRGWQVTVMDQAATASAASGNPQGTLYTRMSHRPSALNDFSLHSFCYAGRYYRNLFESGRLQPGEDGALCGALHLRKDRNHEHPLLESVASLPDLVRLLDEQEAAAITGLAGCPGGLYFPASGWINPAAVCRTLLGLPGITLLENCGPLTLARADDQWLAQDQAGKVLGHAPVAVIASGIGSKQFPELNWLKLQSIRGQTSQIASTGPLAGLKTVICDEGYLPPARHGMHCIGATFDIEDHDPELREQDHDHNIELLRQALPMLGDTISAEALRPADGRVGFRCASPDYLPIIGPVPDVAAFCEDYAGLRRNARRVIARAGACHPGLYLSTGHGSRGLTSTPLGAELLASQVCAEPPPLSPGLCRALSPARFLVRDLVRNRL